MDFTGYLTIRLNTQVSTLTFTESRVVGEPPPQSERHGGAFTSPAKAVTLRTIARAAADKNLRIEGFSNFLG